MTKTLIEGLTYALPLLLIAGLLIGLFLFASLETLHRSLLVYLGTALLVDLVSRYFGLAFGNNLVFVPLFGLLELAYFTWLYWRYFLQGQPMIWLVVPVIALGYIVLECFAARWTDPRHFVAYSRVAGPITVVFLCMLHYREIGTILPVPKDRLRMNSGILLFFSLNMVIFLPVNFLINVPSQVKFWFWLTNLLLTMGFYLFLIREIWKNGKTRPSLERGS